MPIAANGAETFTDFIEELATISVTELYTRLWVQHTSDTELPLFEPTTLTHRDAEPVFVVVDTLWLWANKHTFQRFDTTADAEFIIDVLVQLTSACYLVVSVRG